MVVRTRLLILALTFLVSACASTSKRSQEQLREYVSQHNFDQALEYVRSNEFYQKENERLLKFLEMGLLHHARGEYYQSARAFDGAKRIVEELFTVSISQRAQIYLFGDYRDVYYGNLYEHSLIYFYKALNHYLLSQQGFYEAHRVKDEQGVTHEVNKRELSDSEKREELFRARAELVAWDSFLHSVAADRLGESVFKRDLMANFLGGKIHEAIDTREDREIALQLYQNASEVLWQNYHSYQSFNRDYEKFIEDYDILPELEMEQVKDDYIQPTLLSSQLARAIQYRTLLLTYRHRGPRAYRQERDSLESAGQLDEKVAQWLEEDIQNLSESSQVSVVLQTGLIPQKQGREIFIGLARALENPEVSAGVSVTASILAVFAAEILGLMPPPGSYRPDQAQFGLLAAEVAVREAAIGFEVPEIEHRPIEVQTSIEVWKSRDEDSRELYLVRELPMIQPLGDIAAEAIREHARARTLRQAPRIIGKHIAAIAASYATYKAMGGGDEGNDSMARSIALLQYVAASRAIVASERADVRYWSTLPEDIRMVSFPLPPGNYQIELVRRPIRATEEDEVLGSILLDEIKVDQNTPNLLINKRI